MSLKEDMETLGRYIDAGLGKEYMRGTAPKLPPERDPVDTSADSAGVPTYTLLARRGD